MTKTTSMYLAWNAKLIESNMCKKYNLCQNKSVSLVCVICTIYSSISLVLVSAHEPHKSLLEQLVSNAPERLYSVAVSHQSRVVEIIPLDNVKNSSCAMLSRGNLSLIIFRALPQSWSLRQVPHLLALSHEPQHQNRTRTQPPTNEPEPYNETLEITRYASNMSL